MSSAQGDIMVGNVKSLVDRLSKDFSAAKPPLAIHEPRKTAAVMPKSSPAQHVITTFAYTAAQDDELSLELGDIIEVLEEVEDGWSRGRQLRTGLIGMFPTNFVKPDVTPATASHREEEKVVIRHIGEVDLPEANRRTPSVVGGVGILAGKTAIGDVKDDPKTKEMARVKFEYEPQHNDELRLGEIGQLITIIRKDCGDAGWFEGEINGRRGLFPDNFVELVQVPINTRSGTIYHQPTHHPKLITKAPAATPAGVVPPAVPAKPLKQKLSDSSTSINGASGTSPTLSSVTAAPASVLPSQVKQQNSAFAAARDRISKDLVVGQPGQVASKLTKSVIVTSGPESIATARPVSNIETDEIADDVIRPLSHVTKNRVRPPGKRPVSMLIIKKKGSIDNLIESPTHAAASDVMEKNPFCGTVTTSLSSPASASSNSSKISSSTASAKALPVRPPPAEVKKEEKRDHNIGGAKSSPTVTTHSSMATSLSSSVDSEWVSRKEYNELLARLASLEARVAQLERR